MHRLVRVAVALLLPVTLLGCPPRIDRGPAALVVAQQPARVVVLDEEDDALVLSAAVRAGWAYDPLDHQGLSWLVARAASLDSKVELVPGPELLSLTLACEASSPEDCAHELAQVLTGAHLDSDSLEAAREPLLQWLQAPPPSAHPGAWVARRWLYQAHPYEYLGRSSTVPLLDLQEAQRFHARHYIRQGVAVVARGPGAQQAADTLSQELEALPGLPQPDLALRAPLPEPGPAVRWVQADQPTTLSLVQPLSIDASHPDWPALEAGLDRVLWRGHPLLHSDPHLQHQALAGTWTLQPGEDPTAAARDLLTYLQRIVAGQEPLEQVYDDPTRPWERLDQEALALLSGYPTLSAIRSSAPDLAQQKAALSRHLRPEQTRLVVLSSQDPKLPALLVEESEETRVQGPLDPAPRLSLDQVFR